MTLSVALLSEFAKTFRKREKIFHEDAPHEELIKQCRLGQGTLLEFVAPEWDDRRDHALAHLTILDMTDKTERDVYLDVPELRDVMASYAIAEQMSAGMDPHPNIATLRRAANEVQAYDSSRHRPQDSHPGLTPWI